MVFRIFRLQQQLLPLHVIVHRLSFFRHLANGLLFSLSMFEQLLIIFFWKKNYFLFFFCLCFSSLFFWVLWLRNCAKIKIKIKQKTYLHILMHELNIFWRQVFLLNYIQLFLQEVCLSPHIYFCFCFFFFYV